MPSKKYSTIQGDMWDGVALKTMGSETYMNTLIEANLQYKDIYIFPAGISLRIPEVKAKPTAGLPPWKQ